MRLHTHIRRGSRLEAVAMPTCLCLLRKASGNVYRQNLSNFSLTAKNYVSQPIRITSITKRLRQSRTYATVSTHTPSTDVTDLALIEKPVNKKNETAIASGSKADWAARKELQYLKDPVDVAYHVRAVLKKGEFEHAAHLTRLATKTMNVVVSWNHLIDYQLGKDSIHHALKLYNEVSARSTSWHSQVLTDSN
jgi:hypothetical protein